MKSGSFYGIPIELIVENLLFTLVAGIGLFLLLRSFKALNEASTDVNRTRRILGRAFWKIFQGTVMFAAGTPLLILPFWRWGVLLENFEKVYLMVGLIWCGLGIGFYRKFVNINRGVATYNK